MKLSEYLKESFQKEYCYRVKIAHDCDQNTMTMLEKAMGKYQLVSVAPWKRQPIQENPVEFVRAKHVEMISEVCSTDIVTKYPCQPRVLEVWIAANLGLNHERVLVYDIREARRLESDKAQERMKQDVDRYAEAPELDQDQDHYQADNQEWAGESVKDAFYGEAFNAKFLAELEKIKSQKGADYFRVYPSKDEIMGDNLRPLWDELNQGVNMGKGAENGKQTHTVNQAASRASSSISSN